MASSGFNYQKPPLFLPNQTLPSSFLPQKPDRPPHFFIFFSFSFPSTRILRPSESGDGDGATARWRGPSLFPASSPPTRFFIFRPRWMAKKTCSFVSNKPRRSSNNDRPWVSSFLSSLFGFLVLRVSQCSWYNFPFCFCFLHCSSSFPAKPTVSGDGEAPAKQWEVRNE